ncbi:hypothetical protein AAHC03_016376 [Spirometra sp. Aus1]
MVTVNRRREPTFTEVYLRCRVAVYALTDADSNLQNRHGAPFPSRTKSVTGLLFTLSPVFSLQTFTSQVNLNPVSAVLRRMNIDLAGRPSCDYPAFCGFSYLPGEPPPPLPATALFENRRLPRELTALLNGQQLHAAELQAATIPPTLLHPIHLIAQTHSDTKQLRHDVS